MLAHSLELLLSPLGLSVAVRINLFAAATSAGASAFLFLVAHRILRPVLGTAGGPWPGRAAAALVGRHGLHRLEPVQRQREGLHAQRAGHRRGDLARGALAGPARTEPGSERLLLWALFLMVIGSTNHLMSVLPAPALAVLVLLTAPMTVLRLALPGACAPARGRGAVVQLLPARCARRSDPVINEGDADVRQLHRSRPSAIYTNGRGGLSGAGVQPHAQAVPEAAGDRAQAPFAAQLKNYWQYFDWQWSRGLAATEQPRPRAPRSSLLFLALGLVGLWAAWRADRATFAYLVTLACHAHARARLLPELQVRVLPRPRRSPGGSSTHEVRERDYFFVASFLLWGILAGVGLAWAWAAVASAFDNARRWAFTAPVLAVAAFPLGLNWSWASRAGDYAAHDWAYDLLMSVEPYAVLFTNGDNDTFPLWYLQEVEGVRQGRDRHRGPVPVQPTGIPSSSGTSPRRTGSGRTDAPELAGIYADPTAPPADAVTMLTDEQMDGIGAARLSQDVTVPFPGIAVTYPSGMVLNRDAQLALAFIHDSIDERPIYFAASGGLMSDLGMDPWGVRHGLAVKLQLRDLKAEQPEGLVQGSPEYGGEYFDMPSSLKLYQDVYRFRSLRDRAIWADRSTLNIPWYYYVLAMQMSDVALKADAGTEVVSRLQQDALAFQVVANGGTRGTPGAEVSADTPGT